MESTRVLIPAILRAMSQENVEIIKRAVELFNTGGPEAAAQWCFADDVEFHDPPDSPSPRVARGRDEVREQFNAFNDVWEEHTTEAHEIRAIGPDQVLALTEERFKGRDGIVVQTPAASIFTLQGGQVTRWQAFWSREQALHSAGLST